MIFNLRSVATMALLAGSVGLAHAAGLTLEAGKTVSTDQWTFGPLNGNVIWTLDPDVLTAPAEPGWVTRASIIAPGYETPYAHIPEEPGVIFPFGAPDDVPSTASPGALAPWVVSASLPLQTLQGDLHGNTVTVDSVRGTGGLNLTQGKAGEVSIMPFVSITNLRVDFASSAVYGDLQYNTGSQHDVRLMSFTSGPEGREMTLSRDVGHAFQGALLGHLHLTHEGYDALSLTLRMPGFDSLAEMGNMSVYVATPVSAVPEPGTVILMSMGLGLLWSLTRRKA
jgi:hypothetical protein